MNYTFEFDNHRGYVLVTTSGKASIDGFQRMHRDMLAHPGWNGNLNLLSDHRQLDSHEISAEDVQHMSLWRADLKQLPDRIRIATVVETDLGFGLMRMWEGLTEGFLRADRRIFRSLEEAKAWLEEPRGDATEL
jgi:hypothetical protein